MTKEYVKRSRADWQKVIEEQETSGKSQIEYCREMGISKNTFTKWRGLLKQEAPSFVELKPKAELGGGARLEIEIGGGMTVRIWS